MLFAFILFLKFEICGVKGCFLMKKFVCKNCGKFMEINTVYDVKFCMFCASGDIEELNSVNTLEEGNSFERNIDGNPILKRAFLFIKDGFNADAKIYLEKVLDEDPENAYAYLGKLLLGYNLRDVEELKNAKSSFEDNYFYLKIIEFGDVELKDKVNAELAYVKQRIENALLENKYIDAKNIMYNAVYPKDFIDAAEIFNTIIDYLDSKNHYDFCVLKAEEKKKELLYENAVSNFRRFNTDRNLILMNETLHLFESISGFRDSDEYIAKCKQMIKNRISSR